MLPVYRRHRAEDLLCLRIRSERLKTNMSRTVCVGEEGYRQLLNELADLRRQNTVLQSRMTEMVLQRQQNTCGNCGFTKHSGQGKGT